MKQPMMNFVYVQLINQPIEVLKHSFHLLLVKELKKRRNNRFIINRIEYLQSRCFRFGPIISSVVALQTTFARACPAIVFFAAKSRSTRLCPPGCIVESIYSNKRRVFLRLIIVLVTLFVKVIYTIK